MSREDAVEFIFNSRLYHSGGRGGVVAWWRGATNCTNTNINAALYDCLFYSCVIIRVYHNVFFARPFTIARLA